MIVSIRHLYDEAAAYVGTYHSIQQTEGNAWLLLDIKNNQEKYIEAIVLLHVNPNLPEKILEHLIGLTLNQAKLDIIAGFYVREEMNNGKRSGNEILSGRQMRRRVNRECFELTEIDYESD